MREETLTDLSLFVAHKLTVIAAVRLTPEEGEYFNRKVRRELEALVYGLEFHRRHKEQLLIDPVRYAALPDWAVRGKPHTTRT